MISAVHREDKILTCLSNCVREDSIRHDAKYFGDKHSEEEAILEARNTKAAFTGGINGYIHIPVGTAVKTELKCQSAPPIIQDEHIAHIQGSCYTDPGYHDLPSRVADAGDVGDEKKDRSTLQPASTRATRYGQPIRVSARFSGEVQSKPSGGMMSPKSLRATFTELDDAKDGQAWLRTTARSRAAAKALARARHPPGRYEGFMRGYNRDTVLGDLEGEDGDDCDGANDEDEDTEEDEEDGNNGDHGDKDTQQ